MAFVETAGARIYWRAEGDGSPVLLIMGHLYSSAMWYPLLPALVGKHRAICFDNRGTGQSDTTSGVTLEQLAADALAVLDAAGVQKAHVYGVSLGGGVAAEFAMRYPDRVLSLVLGCTAMKTEKVIVPWLGRLLYRLPRRLFLAALVSRSTPAAYGSAASAEAVSRDRAATAALKFTMRGIREQLMAVAQYVTTKEAVAELKMPVLVLHGDEDKVVPLARGREFADAIPNSRIEVFSGAGHNYQVARGPESTASVLDFFAGVDRTNAVQPG